MVDSPLWSYSIVTVIVYLIIPYNIVLVARTLVFYNICNASQALYNKCNIVLFYYYGFFYSSVAKLAIHLTVIGKNVFVHIMHTQSSYNNVIIAVNVNV